MFNIVYIFIIIFNVTKIFLKKLTTRAIHFPCEKVEYRRYLPSRDSNHPMGTMIDVVGW
jgi:hypothetical protein